MRNRKPPTRNYQKIPQPDKRSRCLDFHEEIFKGRKRYFEESISEGKLLFEEYYEQYWNGWEWKTVTKPDQGILTRRRYVTRDILKEAGFENWEQAITNSDEWLDAIKKRIINPTLQAIKEELTRLERMLDVVRDFSCFSRYFIIEDYAALYKRLEDCVSNNKRQALLAACAPPIKNIIYSPSPLKSKASLLLLADSPILSRTPLNVAINSENEEVKEVKTEVRSPVASTSGANSYVGSSATLFSGSSPGLSLAPPTINVDAENTDDYVLVDLEDTLADNQEVSSLTP